MGLLGQYIGTFHSAKSASDDIDVDAIISACDEVDTRSTELSSISSNFNGCRVGLTKDNLSINGQSYEGNLDNCCDRLVKTEEYIISTTAEIRSAAEQVYNQLQQQYNEEAEAIDRQMINEYNRTSHGNENR